MVGYYRSEEHLKWIMGNNDKGSLVYNENQEMALTLLTFIKRKMFNLLSFILMV